MLRTEKSTEKFGNLQNLMNKLIVAIMMAMMLSSRIVVVQSQHISIFAGKGNNIGNEGAATAVPIFNPTGVTFSSTGDMYVVDQLDQVVRKVNSCQM